MSIEHTCEWCGEEYDLRHGACPACGMSPERKKIIEWILAERDRQVTVEGFDEEHDHPYTDELPRAAACYAVAAARGPTTALSMRDAHDVRIWPWSTFWLRKPHNRQRRLIIAAALIMAELERMGRSVERWPDLNLPGVRHGKAAQDISDIRIGNTPITNFQDDEAATPEEAGYEGEDAQWVRKQDRRRETPRVMQLVIPARLWCPYCGERHVDSEQLGEKWYRRAHTTHRCRNEYCLREFDVFVYGSE